MNVARKGKPGVLVTVPGSLGGPLAKGNDPNRVVYTPVGPTSIQRGNRV